MSGHVPTVDNSEGSTKRQTSPEMRERVQRKRKPLTLLVGMQTSTATREDCVEIP